MCTVHWPLVVFTAALYPTMSATAQMRLLIFAVTIAVATVSFFLVEQPGRRVGVKARAPSRGRWRGRNLATAMCGACLLAAAFVGLLSTVDRERLTVSPAAAAAISPAAERPAPVGMTIAGKPPRNGAYATTVQAWQRVIRKGLTLRELPTSLRPLSHHLWREYFPRCLQGARGALPDECVVGNPAAGHVAVLDGDSHATMLRNAVWRSFDPKRWSFHVFAWFGCGWAGTSESNGGSAAECRRHQDEALRRIRTLHPDVLVLSEHRVVTPLRSRADIAASLGALTRAAPQTIVLGHTPLPRPWRTCLVGYDISQCFASLDATFRSDTRVERELASRAGTTFVDTSAWVCTRAGAASVCPPVIGGAPVFSDDTHIDGEFQLKLIPIVRALLQSAGVRL